MTDLRELSVDGLSRADEGGFDFFARLKTEDGIYVSIFDVREATSKNAYWLRAFGDKLCKDLLVNAHISESTDPDLDDIAETVADMVVAARFEQGAESVEDAGRGLTFESRSTEVAEAEPESGRYDS